MVAAAARIKRGEQDKLHRLLESFGLRPDARTKVTACIRAQLQLFEGGPPASGPIAPDSDGMPQGFADFT